MIRRFDLTFSYLYPDFTELAWVIITHKRDYLSRWN
jgi:hypothetical protein